MLEKMVTALVLRMEEEKITNTKEREYYKFAFMMLAEKLFIVGTLVGIGVIQRQLLETFIFLLFFFTLRKRTGGYHAKQFYQCYFLSVLVYLVAMKGISFFFNHVVFMYVLLGICVLLIAQIGTINHPNMDMDMEELEENKHLARMVAIVEVVVIVCLSILHTSMTYIACMSCAIIVCSLSLGFAKIIGQEVKR